MKKALYLFISLFILGTVQSNAQCSADFGYFVNGPSVSFLDSSSYPPSTFISYSWDFGDGNTSTMQNPSHNYGLAGTYNVCLVIEDSLRICSDTICKIVTASSGFNCTASFTYVINNNNTVVFTNTGSTNAAYSWNFGDGSAISTINNPTHTYTSPGSYTVTLTGQSTGGQCSTSTVIVVNFCTANFTSTVGSNGSVSFTNNSTPINSQVAFDWNFGDGSPLVGTTNPTHTYTSNGTYVVTLNMFDSTGNCSATYSDSVVVNIGNPNSCNASYTIAKDSSVAYGVVLYNTSSNFSSHSYSWDFGDGTTGSGRTPIHLYQSFGSYVVCLTITDLVLNCSDTFCDTVGMDSLGNLKTGFGIRVLDQTTVGINENKNNLQGVSLYPNPATDAISVDFGTKSPSALYKVIDISGKELIKGQISNQKEKINLNNLEKGIYFILFDDGVNSEVKKFIKL